MIRIKIDLIPGGLKAAKKELGIVEIWNDGTGTPENGNYCYEITKHSGEKSEGRITNFPRKKEDVYCLLWRVMGSYRWDKDKETNGT